MGRSRALYTALHKIAGDEDLLAQYHTTAAAVSRDAADTLRAFIELGRAELVIQNDVARGRRLSGQHSTSEALGLLATALGVSRQALRRASQVIGLFDGAQIESFLTRTNTAGHLITPGHLKAIAKADSEGKRHKFIELFYEQALTPQQIGARVLRQRPPRSTARARVRCFEGGVANLCTMAQTMARAIEHGEYGLREVLFDRLRAFAQGDSVPDPGDMERVTRLRVALDKLLNVLALAVELAADAEIALEQQLRSPE